MTAKTEARRLTHSDIGKTITAPWRGGDVTAPLLGFTAAADKIWLELDYIGAFALPLDPHQRISITGKEPPR